MTDCDCTQWLKSKPHGSVLYISFGSFALCSKNNIEEIATGLLLSEVNFIWALRPNIVRYDEDYILPVGFLDEIKGRGRGRGRVDNQPTNRKLVVDDWRIGLNLCDGKSLTREEVAKKIGHLMSGKSMEDLRKEIIKVKKTLENVLAVNGSSAKNLCQFITDVKAKISEHLCLGGMIWDHCTFLQLFDYVLFNCVIFE
ncbi:hypothetical protein TIFTF001_008416 [Ficus carica]|uniref:Uncharacterized protein n=1 Tax=Ficus carica TaxID=3494 RepID=A0AA88AF11_FICCA|nr:hypothetical protein TIFTF001_008416 [Ficus carica]